MKLPSLYVIAADYLSAAEKLADLDLDEQTIADTLESMSGDLEVKATNVAMFVRNLESTAEQIKLAEAEMAKRRKSIESRADKVREYIKENMQRTGITKIESPYFDLSIKKNPPSVLITDPGKIPSDLYVYPKAPDPYPDKSAIKEKLKVGEFIDGAEIQQVTRLEIK